MSEPAELVPGEMHQDRNMNEVPGSGGMDASELVESLLSNEHVPLNIQKEMWVLFGKSTKLSFLKDEDIRLLKWQFELLRLTIIESVPKSDYDEAMELKLIQVQMEFELNLNRSKGSRLNERELLGSSTSASFTERPMGHASDDPGFLSKISRMFGGK